MAKKIVYKTIPSRPSAPVSVPAGARIANPGGVNPIAVGGYDRNETLNKMGVNTNDYFGGGRSMADHIRRVMAETGESYEQVRDRLYPRTSSESGGAPSVAGGGGTRAEEWEKNLGPQAITGIGPFNREYLPKFDPMTGQPLTTKWDIAAAMKRVNPPLYDMRTGQQTVNNAPLYDPLTGNPITTTGQPWPTRTGGNNAMANVAPQGAMPQQTRPDMFQNVAQGAGGLLNTLWNATVPGARASGVALAQRGQAADEAYRQARLQQESQQFGQQFGLQQQRFGLEQTEQTLDEAFRQKQLGQQGQQFGQTLGQRQYEFGAEFGLKGQQDAREQLLSDLQILKQEGIDPKTGQPMTSLGQTIAERIKNNPLIKGLQGNLPTFGVTPEDQYNRWALGEKQNTYANLGLQQRGEAMWGAAGQPTGEEWLSAGEKRKRQLIGAGIEPEAKTFRPQEGKITPTQAAQALIKISELEMEDPEADYSAEKEYLKSILKGTKTTETKSPSDPLGIR